MSLINKEIQKFQEFQKKETKTTINELLKKNNIPTKTEKESMEYLRNNNMILQPIRDEFENEDGSIKTVIVCGLYKRIDSLEAVFKTKVTNQKI